MVASLPDINQALGVGQHTSGIEIREEQVMNKRKKVAIRKHRVKALKAEAKRKAGGPVAAAAARR